MAEKSMASGETGPKSASVKGGASAKSDVTAVAAARTDDAERRLARRVAVGLPLFTIVAALAVGAVASVGPALLVLAGGTLVGTVALLWASLRTLGGDAPLPMDIEALDARAHRSTDAEERKREVLRALKDLEH
ncbi:MAG TPA: hypothetical protein VNO21_16745, partial [Polyangiaceae bacterium]|nr:hypothetical protein [Polyangiaceae bacterium]